MTPPGLTPWIQSPGYVGGSDWGGASIDLDHGVMVVNSAKLANYSQLITRKEADADGLKPLGADAKSEEVGGAAVQKGTPYAVKPAPFMSPLGVPCQQPPYGYLSAIDLVTGKLIWSHTLGSARDSGRPTSAWPRGCRA
ncbi:PQQ-binding-like beta-propeller repeat protein [Neorhizobium sp. S3-V5DH]|uniref:PQQ-binding-like beta-propeller repeat protein n=1 Tax=Neorhizobium sp. S3-V5DH TaxID=2485166 RepID=UPI0010455123|nr:PQQ-binding-like beta-propeller repeat protein [Neorhizobium sp. S3-V5DH]TCV67438.1 PQQ enzyme-like repeat protein [Neorhizobium sp. S3-V5DH]